MTDTVDRVLLVTPDYPPPPGGIQTITRNLESGLEAAGIDVRVVHVDPDGYDRSIADLVPRRRWVYSPWALATGQFVYLNAVYRRSREAIRDFDPDVVHSMHVRCWPAMAAAAEQDRPTALSTYALELGERSLAADAIRAADCVHAISEFTAGLVRDVAEPSTVKLIPPSIDVSAYEDLAARTERSEPASIVTLARFVDRKNIETVIRAWQELPTDVRDGRELVVAGDGPNRDTLKDLAGDDEAIRFPGWVNGEEKRELLAEGDAFVMVPRRDGYDVEGFGIVYIEAQAAGTPVVGSRHGGAPEAIGDAGIVVDDEEDPQEVASAIEQLVTNDDRRADYLAAARDRIHRFAIGEVTGQFTDLYARLSE